MNANPTVAAPVIPYADQYLGAWAIMEEYAHALLQQAQHVNVQLHLEQAQQPAARAAVAAQASTELSVTRDGVAVIELSGSLTKHASSLSASRSMVAARRQVRAAMNDPAVAGILLHIDSPGGTVAGTIDLADDVSAAAKQKPVYTYFEDLGGSGAYWIGAQATKVYANRGARVGSIGAFNVVVDFSAMAAQQGIKVNVVKFGAFKGTGIEGTAVTPEQLAELQKSIDAYGQQFVEAVAAGRGLSPAQAQRLADGRVHDAATAIELQLIDGVQSFEATLAGLVAAGKKPTRSKPMSTTTETDNSPQAATHKELKAALPGASAEFILGQLDAGATVSDALQAFNSHLSAELAKAHAAQAEAEQAAAKRASGAPSPAPLAKTRGNRFAAQADAGVGEAEVAAATDYVALAKDVQKERGCSYREACRVVKKQYPEARAAFIGDPLKG